MNTPILAPMPETDTPRGVLRLCAIVPRPIPYPKISLTGQLGGQR